MSSRASGNSAAMGGHVTPTFGHGGIGTSQFAPPSLQCPPLSPNRMHLSSSNLNLNRAQYGMRHHETQPQRRPLGAMVMGMSAQRNYSNEHYPSVLDPTEFPSLTSRNMGGGEHVRSMPAAKPYGNFSRGMVKQPQSESSAFTMSSEDFPALPGTTPTSNANENSGKATPSSSQPTESSDSRVSIIQDKKQPRGIQTTPEGKVTNIPQSMVADQYGMVGLLTFIRVAETDPNLVSLALGFDLTALGLNLNATDSLYPSFGGPWAEGPVRAEDIDYPVPTEYNISEHLRDKLTPPKLNRYKDELLFYLFYTYSGDVLQMLAAGELYNRDWRYHKEEKIWITRAPGVQAQEKGSNFERGTYYFFDPISWRKVGKEFFLEYEKLEERPAIPPSYAHACL